MEAIPMVDLKSQYLAIQKDIDTAIAQCLMDADFIQGKSVTQFEKSLCDYTGIQHCVACGNGTDALQLALMSLDLPKGSKILVPAFTYIAPVEVIAFLGYEPVFADVATDFNVSLETIKTVLTKDIKAIIVVHLFGQPCKDIDAIYNLCKTENIALIEDNAQSLGAEKNIKRNSLITTSFYPTKNLGAFGDGGAVFCNNMETADKIRQIASHGQRKKYIHDRIGINSRLDSIQATILNVKLHQLNTYNSKRRAHAAYYHKRLKHLTTLELPEITDNHIFHQFTLKVKNGKRNELEEFLKQKNISTIINYPLPAYKQLAYLQDIHLLQTESFCAAALSIPVYPEISETQLSYICDSIEEFFNLHD